MEAKIRQMMQETHQFFADELERHGFGNKSFRIEKDNADKIVVHTIKAKHPTQHYNTRSTYDALKAELPAKFNNLNNAHALFVGGLKAVNIARPGVALSTFGGKIGGYALIPANQMLMIVVAHELGHVFGLNHNILVDEGRYVMHSNSGHDGFAHYEARWLANSHYFNDNRNINVLPKVDKIQPPELINPETIGIKFEIQSPNGVYQTHVIREDGAVVGWDYLGNKPKETAEVEIKRFRIARGDIPLYFILMDSKGIFWRIKSNVFIPRPPPEPKPDPKETDLAVSPKHKLTTSWAAIKAR